MLKIKKIEQSDIKKLFNAFDAVSWNKPIETFEKYLEEDLQNERFVYIANYNNDIAGDITLKFKSTYPHFAKENIPEIMDLNVLPKFRNKGIATKLLDLIENEIAKKYDKIGLGVGLYKDYGSTQSIYIKRGYLPNKLGVSYNYVDCTPGENYRLDDDLILWFIKQL